MPAPDRVAMVVILTKIDTPTMTAPATATANTLTLGMRRAGRKREVSIRVERRDDRRRRQHEGDYPRRSGAALKGLPGRVPCHLGLPFTRAFALVAPLS